SNLYDAIYSPALSTLTGWLVDLTGAAQTASAAAEHHSPISRYVAFSLTALGGGAYYGLQGLAAFGTMTAFAGEGVKALGKLGDVQGHYLRVLYAWGHIKNVAEAVKGFGGSLIQAVPSIGRFGAALYANPLTWYIAGAVALGAAAYEIYEHWDPVSAFFKNMCGKVEGYFSSFEAWLKAWAPAIGKWLLIGLTGPLGVAAIEIYQHWDGIKEIFAGAVDWLKTAGLNMMKSLDEGILAGIEWPVKAAARMAEKIGGFFHFHSPPEYGPLREAVLHFRLGEELAKHIQPAPLIGAAARMAAEIAAAVWDRLKPVPTVRTSPPGPFSLKGEGEPFAPWDKRLHLSFLPPFRGKEPGMRVAPAPEIAVTPVVNLAARFGEFAKNSQPFLSPPPLFDVGEGKGGGVAAPIVNLALPKPITAAPAMIMAAAPERIAAATGTVVQRESTGAAVTINLTYSPTIKSESPDEWMKVARQHSRDLMRIISDELTRRQRLAFT
ncbi:MAG: hypothetical protein JO189_12760, partial [Deltaproteobacteria bacterium]|nr:hypothetical protein [Deltaproteobacteria bacterium]